jgi:hypothetical protein
MGICDRLQVIRRRIQDRRQPPGIGKSSGLGEDLTVVRAALAG